MIKILFFENSIGFGGALVSLYHIVKYINKDCFEPHVVISYYDEFLENFENIPIYYIPRNRKFTKTGKLLASMRQAINIALIINKKKINLIHLNNSILGNLGGLLAAKITQKPVLQFQRGTIWFSKSTKIFSKFPNRYAAISKFIKNQLLLLDIPSSVISIVYPSIEPEKFVFKQNDKLTKSTKNIGILGCLVYWKGQDIFIKAIDILIKKNYLVKGFIIGDAPPGNESYKMYLLSLVKDLKLERNIYFTGKIYDIQNFISHMDVMVHASVEPEPFGRVIIEGMAMKKPIIATNIGAPPEIIQHMITGLLIPPGDPVALAKAIEFLLLNEKQAVSIGIAAQKWVFEKYNANLQTKNIEKIYYILQN